MTEEQDIARSMDALASAINELNRARVESQPGAKAADGGRYAAASEGTKAVADELAALDERREVLSAAEQKAAIREAVNDALKSLRPPSQAAAIGTGAGKSTPNRIVPGAGQPASPTLKAAFTDYRSGELFSAIEKFAAAKQFMDVDLANEAKAELDALGVWHSAAPQVPGGYHLSADGDAETGWAKATTGATGSTGGYVLPNNLVDTVIKPATQRAVLQNLVTTINGVNVRGVDQPFRTGAPARMQFQDWNTSKENVNETYGTYTAYLGTIARVMDITKQYARFSAGAAERDVMDELTRAAVLGENYYIVGGAGTGTIGSGDPTTGVYTALNARPGFKAAFSSASTSTVAGSFASACSTLMQNVAANNREVSAILVDHTTFFTSIREGSDTAGFWVDPSGGPTGFSRTGSGGLTYWGVPVYYDTNLGTEATTKIAIGAQWDMFKLYRGMEFRIDTTDVAGTRWDYNLIGYRAEEEIGFHAGSAVEVGAGFLLTAVIP